MLVFFAFLMTIAPAALLWFQGPVVVLAALMFLSWMGLGTFPLFMGVIPTETVGRLIIAKVNTDPHQRTAARLQVRSIPTLAIWKGGTLRTSEPGARQLPQLLEFVRPYLPARVG